MHDVFISYARTDSVDVERLLEALESAKIAYWRDTEDLAAGNKWRPALREAIIDSDNLLFVISPTSIDSKHCNMELAFAHQHNKRIIPVVYRDPRADQVLPEILESWQHLVLDWAELDVEAIARVLRNEAVWRNQSSEYLRRAKKWENSSGDLLPRGDLDAARVWMESGAKMEPGPLELQVRYIQQSEAFHLKEAERWKKLYAKTLARQLAAQAEVMIGQRGVLLETAALLAVESMRRSHTALGDRVLRMALFLLPREVSTIHWPGAKKPRLVEFSQDGSYVAASSEDGTVGIWELASAREVCRLEAGPCRKLRFQPGSNKLLTMDTAVTVWSLEQDAPVARVSHDSLSDADFSGDGAFLATIGGDGVTRLWDIDDYEELASYRNAQAMASVAVAAGARELIAWNKNAAEVFQSPGQSGVKFEVGNSVVSFQYSPDGLYLSQLSPLDYAASLHDVLNREQILFEERHWSGAFSGDSRFFALASPEWDAYAYDLPTTWQAGHYWEVGKKATMVRKHIRRRVSCRRGESVHHDDSVQTVSLSHQGRYLGTTSRDGTARVWEQRRGREVLRLLENVVGPINRLLFSADERFVSGWGEAGCWTWEATGHRQVAALRHGDAVWDVSFSGDGRFAATISKDRTCRVWSIPDGSEVQQFSMASATHKHTVSINQDGSRILTNGRTLWDVATGAVAGELPVDADTRVGAVSDDWAFAVVVHKDNAIAVVALDDGRVVGRRDSYDGTVGAMAICPETGRTAVAVEGLGIRVWDWCNDEDLSTAADAIQAEQLAFGGAGSALVMVDKTDRRNVYVLNLADAMVPARQLPHEAKVTSACLDADAVFLLTTSVDKTARVWSLATGEPVAALTHDADVITARFSPDGRYVLSAGGRSDRTARLWFWRPEDLLAETCSRLSRDLTEEEWTQYLGGEPYRRTRSLEEDGVLDEDGAR